MNTKICTACSKKLPATTEYFYKKSGKFGVACKCKECEKQISQKYYTNHRNEKIQHQKEYNKKHKEERNKYNRQYRKEHKEKTQQYNTIYNRQRRQTDVDYKIKTYLSNRIRNALNRHGKSKHTMAFLGCSIEQLKGHLQETAIQNGYLDFEIENYSGSEYHIDHIIPCASFDLSQPEEQKKCFHWSNLQILTAEENLQKSAKLYFF